MSIVDRIVFRLIHRDKRGAVHRGHGEMGGEHGRAHGLPHGEEALTAPGRFAGEHADRYARRSRSRSRRRFYRRTARDVARLAPGGGLVLDVGSGPGGLVVEIARARSDLRLAGADLEPAMVRLAGELVAEAGIGDRVELYAADVAELPLEDASVDVVVASLTAHHWPDVPRAVRELARVIRPGGVLLVVDFASAVEGPLGDAVAELIPGAQSRRSARWMRGLPALVSWQVRVPGR